MRISFETVGLLLRAGDRDAGDLVCTAGQGHTLATETRAHNRVYVRGGRMELWSRRDENDLFEYIDTF